jgi:excisionase family DNA binding protein
VKTGEGSSKERQIMKESYYRTGQAAKLLGVSSYHVRRLCEAGEIESEISAGQQWKIPLAEVARLKREGVPPVPVEVEDEHPIEHDEEPEEESEKSPRVIEAADDVRITASRLEKRRLERESEEVEDWFRERQRKEALEQAAERQKAESAQREQRRQQWTHEWIAYALDSLLPQGTPREAELDVHAGVRQALAGLDINQPSPITKRIVAAAVEKALRPWTRKREIEQAIEAAMLRLAWEVRNGAAFAGLRQQARDAAVSAIRKAGEDAGPKDLAAVAMQAMEPMMREYEHHQLCERALSWIYVSGASGDEQEAARDAARKAVAALPGWDFAQADRAGQGKGASAVCGGGGEGREGGSRTASCGAVSGAGVRVRWRLRGDAAGG